MDNLPSCFCPLVILHCTIFRVFRGDEGMKGLSSMIRVYFDRQMRLSLKAMACLARTQPGHLEHRVGHPTGLKNARS